MNISPAHHHRLFLVLHAPDGLHNLLYMDIIEHIGREGGHQLLDGRQAD